MSFGWKAHFDKFNFPDDVKERLINATVKSGAWNEYDRGVLTDEEIVEGFIKNDPEMEKELRMITEDFTGLLPQYEYTKGLILDLKKKGFKVYALSNMSYKAVRECADGLDFLPLLDGYILSCDVKIIKPDHEIYNMLLEKYGLTASETVFFDDTKANVDAAIECGWHAIRFRDLKQAIGELEELVNKEGKAATPASKYTKPQRIAALVCVCLIGAVYAATLILAFINGPVAKSLLKIALGCTLVLPILTWIYIWMIGKLTHKDTIADFHFFESGK